MRTSPPEDQTKRNEVLTRAERIYNSFLRTNISVLRQKEMKERPEKTRRDICRVNLYFCVYDVVGGPLGELTRCFAPGAYNYVRKRIFFVSIYRRNVLEIMFWL